MWFETTSCVVQRQDWYIFLYGEWPCCTTVRTPYYGRSHLAMERGTTAHHYMKTWQSVNPDTLKSFQCTCSSTVAKTIKHMMKTGSHEFQPMRGVPSSLECQTQKPQSTAAQIRASSRNVATSLHGQIATKKPLLTKSKKKKRGAWNRKEWTLDQWKSVLWSDESKFEIFSIFFFERMPRVCKTVKAKGGYFENIKHILVCLTLLV